MASRSMSAPAAIIISVMHRDNAKKRKRSDMYQDKAKRHKRPDMSLVHVSTHCVYCDKAMPDGCWYVPSTKHLGIVPLCQKLME
jgi:hypothetical protein